MVEGEFPGFTGRVSQAEHDRTRTHAVSREMKQMIDGKQQALLAMEGKQPARIPMFVSAYWDYFVRAAGAGPLDWAYGGFQNRLGIEIKAARRHDGAWLHRTEGASAQAVPREPQTPKDIPPCGSPPWTGWIEKYLPHLVKLSEGAEAGVAALEDIPRVLAADQLVLEFGEDTTYMKAVVSALSSDTVIAAGGFGLFPHTRRCMGGIYETMTAIMDSPDLVEALMDAILDSYEGRIKVSANAGADLIWHGAYNEGADTISPDLWRRLIYPRHERMVKMCHNAGMKAVCWFLGDCLPLIEDIARAGYDLLAIEQSRGTYSSDVGEMRRRVGKDLCLTGWVPEMAMIRGDRDEITRCVEEQVEAAGRDGAFIFSTSMLDSSVDPDTVDFLCRKLKELSG